MPRDTASPGLSSQGCDAFPRRAFLLTALANAVWINASEVFRYFVFVMGRMRESLPGVPDVAPMDLGVFAIWGLWDTILVFAVTGVVWLSLERFGRGIGHALIAGTLVWVGIFGLFWIGLYNMNLATLELLSVALPLAWLELLIASLIVLWGMNRFDPDHSLGASGQTHPRTHQDP